MKRIVFTFVMAALVPFVAKAESVSKSEAFNTAQQYLLSKGKILNQSRTPYRAVRKVKGQPESSYYYIFNAEGGNGYVIVSGDDRTPEILGYVDNGSFDEENIPDNMKSWLQLYVDQIKYLVDNNITVDKRAIKARAKAQATRHSVPELLTTRWNQGRPYNITCPKYYLEDDTEEKTSLPERTGPATGCTATAMAQVIAYYKYPAALKTAIPSYSITYYSKKDGSSKSVSQNSIPRATPIDWDNMRDTYDWEDGHVANAQDSAVANLMHMCGQAVKMHYGPSSGANFDADVFIKYFGFDNSAFRAYRSDYSIDDWFDMIYKDIAAGYPVCFAGFSSGGGHAFVLDGFDGENLFHVNWGWGGGSNGWFLVGILNPGDNSGIGASSSSDGYSMGQYALFNLRLPDKDNADTYLFIKDVSTSGTYIKATFENRTGASGNFQTCVVKLEDDGSTSLVSPIQSISSMANGTSQTKNFPIKSRLPEGTHKLSPACKPSRGDVWQPKYNMRSQYIEAVVDSNGDVTLTPVNITEGNSISIDTIVFPGTRIVGKEQEVKVTFRNNGNEYFKEIHLFASKTNEKVYTNSRSIVAVRKGETVDVSYYFEPKETGTYHLWLCTGSNGSGVVGEGTMEIISESEAPKASLSVKSYSVTNASNGVIYGTQMVGKAGIQNTDKIDFKGRIKLQLWYQPNGSGYAWGSSEHTYDVDIMAGQIAYVDFHYEGLNENNKYFIAASFVDRLGDFANSGVWDLGGWDVKNGVDLWKSDGTVTGKAHALGITVTSNICGFYADCSKKISRVVPNSSNPNVIYAFSSQMDIPSKLENSNVVSGSHSDNIQLVNGKPYYIPISFQADTATFVYTFPAESETEIAWQTITMPFDVDSISRGDFTYQLNDSLNHFWIYEFAATDNNGNPIFKPATVLRRNTPYIIACDAMFKGKTITFTGYNKDFFKTGSDKMIVSSDTYCQYGNTYQPKVANVYLLNEGGTAFEYVATSQSLPALSSYFTTKLPEEKRLEQILLPELPWSCSKAAGWGDINMDQRVDDADIDALAKTLVLKSPDGIRVEYGDVDGDGKITIADLVSLINKANN